MKSALEINHQLQQNCLQFKQLNDKLMADSQQMSNAIIPELQTLLEMKTEMDVMLRSKVQQIEKQFQSTYEKVESVMVEMWKLKNNGTEKK